MPATNLYDSAAEAVEQAAEQLQLKVDALWGLSTWLREWTSPPVDAHPFTGMREKPTVEQSRAISLLFDVAHVMDEGERRSIVGSIVSARVTKMSDLNRAQADLVIERLKASFEPGGFGGITPQLEVVPDLEEVLEGGPCPHGFIEPQIDCNACQMLEELLSAGAAAPEEEVA